MPQPAFGRRSVIVMPAVSVQDLGWYWRSLTWKKVREMAMKRAGGRCQRPLCGKKATAVTHKHFRTLGHESFADLNVTCHRHSKGDV